MGSKNVLNLWKKRKSLFHTGNLNRNFPYSSTYPSRYIESYIPGYSMSTKKVKRRGKCKSGKKKENKILSIQIIVREKKRKDTFTKREDRNKK